MTDMCEAARTYYQAELTDGVERFLETRRDTCPWCGSTDLSVRLKTTDLLQHKPGQFTLEQCGTCRHIFQNPRLTPAGLDFYYRDFYDGLGQQLFERIFAAQGPSYDGRAQMLVPFTTPKAWLDVGTGYGHFCNAARKRWPHTTFDGLDQSDSVEKGQRRGWVDRSYRGDFAALAGELASRYDVVSMNHYLEHTREPMDELDTAAKVVLPGGYLLIEVPDPEFVLGRVFGRFWIPWFQPQHQHFIPVDNLMVALADRGFSPVAVQRGEAHVRGSDLTTSLALALNVCAPDPHVPWLAAEPARWRRVWHPTVRAAGLPPLVAAYLIDMLLYQVVRRTRGGNAYRVLARKDS